ncbi:MAG: hypothetical protein KBG20_03795 [Caldilineaceae bacterium]|nr:hypothetical protein [Caldilineaceae bacterium]MBP8106552.1 hypothetical protein [Caldilineaceae bacterium]MBP8121574.1 hypothetical protein [Caldilineaceae bacterium]MBP9071391.1 hypothetical protein [Caldilineaceae bacterium]
MNHDTLLPLLDRLPSDPHTFLGLPAALAPHLSTVKRATRRPQPWTEYRLLAALALSGWSFRYGLGADPNSGQTKRAFHQLTSAGLWEEQRVRITVNAVLVRLTPLARSLLTEVGLTPVESEWERMERLHRGDTSTQLAHTAAVCTFAHHARTFGYDAQVCPDVDGPAEPDVLLVKDEETLFVEVQRRGGEPWRRVAKWHNLARLQGEVLLCAETPAQAHRFAQEARVHAGASQGRFTDLVSLFNGTPGLFTHQWSSRYMEPEVIAGM